MRLICQPWHSRGELHTLFLDGRVILNGLHTLWFLVEKCPDQGLGERLGNEFLLPLYELQEKRLAEYTPIRS
jgi:hypothetical protein